MNLRLFLLALVALALPSILAAEDAAPSGAQHKAADAPDPPPPPPNISVTHHEGRFNGVALAYRATAGETYLKNEQGKPTAAIFSVAYVREGAVPGTRPVTFLFNGGPGSGSLWLHMGAFGPKRVVIPSDARDDGAPPYPLVDNAYSLLDVTDIVFIDPVGTGFSHALAGTEPADFWSVTKDAKSIAQFIRLWLGENGRWNSPKYLGGESYGTTRSAAVLHELEGQYNDVALNGVILISAILDFGAQAEVPGNEMQYVLNLPSMAAAAWYHDKVTDRPATVEAFAEQARQFALGDYASALLLGTRLPAERRAEIRSRLAHFTGLSEAYLDHADLRVSPGRFFKELLRDRGLTTGRLDTRYTGVDRDSAGETPDDDPSFYAIDGAYTAALNAYVRGDLGFRPDREYVTIGGVGKWDFRLDGDDSETYMNVAPYIGTALRENSGLRIFDAQGYFDFATPFLGAEYALSRPGIPQDRIHFEYYHAGHMMYVREEDLAKLSGDIHRFISQSGTGR